MSSPNKKDASTGQLVLRWCCYALLWIGTALSIATVSVCDFHRFISYTAELEKLVLTGGLFCYSVEFRDEVEYARYGDNVFGIDIGLDADSSRKAAQAFGTLAVMFIPMALLLFHVVFFAKLPNPAVAKGLWITICVLAIAAMVSVSLTFVFYEGIIAECKELDCRVGPGAILAAINAILLIVLTVCLFVSGPPKSPFRCGSCQCCEDGSGHREDQEGHVLAADVLAVDGGVTKSGAVRTTTTEEVMEDGRLCITTETVDAYGNKKIVKKTVAAGQ